MKKKQQWMKFRHRVIRNLAFAVLYPLSRGRYGITVEKFKEQGDRAYLILMNHQTAFDQFFAGMAFSGPVYYVASEDLFSKGWVSSLIRWLVAPIPIKKQTTDPRAVMTCIRVAREGGTIAIAPEGNRTYSGKTEYMNPAIAALAKKIKLPIALYRIEGGSGAHPRWSDTVRKGKMRGYVSEVIEPEEFAKMTDDALYERIKTGLFIDEGVDDARFTGNKRAEYLERAYYVCPFCGLSTFESHGNEVTCTKCNRSSSYGEDKRLTGDLPFSFTTEWYTYQQDLINKLDVTKMTATPLYREKAALSKVLVYDRKIPLREEASIALYGDRITVDEKGADPLIFPFETLSAVTVLGRNKLNIYFGDDLYQLKGDKRFNALKYVNIFYRYKNITKDDPSGFLGI